VDEWIALYPAQAQGQLRYGLSLVGPSDQASWDIELPLVTPSGRQIHVRVTGQAAFEGGRCVRWTGTVQDISARHEAEQRARDAARWLPLATAAGGIGTWYRHVDPGTSFWDATLREIHGVALDAPVPSVSDVLDRIVHPDDRAIMQKFLRDRYWAPTAIEAQYRIVRPGGQVRHVLTRGQCLRAMDGTVVATYGTTIDLTERRAAQLALVDAHAQLSLATRIAGLGIWEYDLRRGSFSVDAQIRELFGQRADWQPSVEAWLACIHPDHREAANFVVRRAAASAAGAADASPDLDEPLEYCVQRPDGRLRQVQQRYRTQFDATGNQTRLVGTVLDITAIREAERERDEVRGRLENIADAVGLGTWEHDLDSGHWHLDARMAALLGQPGDALDADRWLEHVHPDDQDKATRSLYKAREQHGPYHVELRVVWPDQSVHWVQLRGQLEPAQRDRGARLVGVSWDLTQVRQAEIAARSNQAKTEFLSRMSHELRTPLNSILGFAQLMELDRKQPLLPAQAERMRQVTRAGWHLLSLINDVLDLSRVESGHFSLSATRVPLAALVDECVSMLGAQAQDRRITVNLWRDSEVASVSADRLRLRQVLLNLLSNAIKYNREGGRIDVSVQASPGHAVSVAVRDTGRGMNPQQLAQLFQPFNRLGVEHEAIEGVGIGLALSRKLVEQMGGRMEVTSEAAVGTEFRVTFPLAGVETAARAGPEGLSAGEGVEQRSDVVGCVLYIEDNPANLAVVASLLSLRPGVKLVTAADGARGQLLAAAAAPDLILLDVRLPDIDGLLLARQLREASATCHIPIVGVSANAMQADVDAGARAGMVAYLTKPIDARLFLATLDAHLGQERFAPAPPPASCGSH
jgi:signal transduction histidine kinase/CheY-like chemotaxis protein